MLVVYLITLIVGGALLAMTLILGGDADADADADASADAEVDANGDGAGGVDVLLGWLPITSMRFWTFFAAFFGLTGTILAGWSLTGAAMTAVLAVAVGYVSGLAMDRAVRHLRQNETSSGVGSTDLIGATAKVLVPVGENRTGKVRVEMKDRSLDMLAEVEGQEELQTGETAMVLSMRGDGHVVVTRGEKLEG